MRDGASGLAAKRLVTELTRKFIENSQQGRRAPRTQKKSPTKSNAKTTPSRSEAKPRTVEVVSQAGRIFSVAFRLVAAALLPVDLRSFGSAVAVYLEQLGRYRDSVYSGIEVNAHRPVAWTAGDFDPSPRNT